MPAAISNAPGISAAPDNFQLARKFKSRFVKNPRIQTGRK